jgi:hypothetical protein
MKNTTPHLINAEVIAKTLGKSIHEPGSLIVQFTNARGQSEGIIPLREVSGSTAQAREVFFRSLQTRQDDRPGSIITAVITKIVDGEFFLSVKEAEKQLALEQIRAGKPIEGRIRRLVQVEDTETDKQLHWTALVSLSPFAEHVGALVCDDLLDGANGDGKRKLSHLRSLRTGDTIFVVATSLEEEHNQGGTAWKIKVREVPGQTSAETTKPATSTKRPALVDGFIANGRVLKLFDYGALVGWCLGEDGKCKFAGILPWDKLKDSEGKIRRREGYVGFYIERTYSAPNGAPRYDLTQFPPALASTAV